MPLLKNPRLALKKRPDLLEPLLDLERRQKKIYPLDRLKQTGSRAGISGAADSRMRHLNERRVFK